VITGDLEGPSVAFFFLGVFGPASAAAIVTRAGGGSIRDWLRRIFRFRLPARYYVAALGFPIVLTTAASAGFALAGESLDLALVGERAASFVPLLIFCLLLNGGPEEPGWRGFALPRLQERFSPVKATFTYTYVCNRTRSVVICMVLHAAYNTSLGALILRPEDELVGGAYVKLSLILTGLLWVAAIGLIIATRGRLGLGADTATVRASVPPRRPGAPAGPRPRVPTG